MNVEIKAVDDSYTNQITQLISNIQQNEFNIAISIEDQPDLLAIEDFYIAKGGHFFGAFLDDELVGTIALVKFDEHSGAIRKMFVKKEFRGKELNIAQKLLDVLIDHCHKTKIENLFLGTVSVLKAAQRFYERNGFEIIEKSRLPDKFPLMSADNVFYSINLK
ncbi:GNAT family N-acetyltransferase [Epilithonimonas ginsengisoli]|uniref:GNAT family N-acetyltransferase n=1 Tax=Epilithonimonas ginsengisoli TaxID=1245592 RepID=A0ABU4JN21_9FLAO|nr:MULTISPECIES: GNAT family N-acetyltransferase [Chryseobacterium group]MBV6881758.1 GNAT family N-acetyltransferase [Epilithonimonas sp. FP105]MDW8551060.1 GNAT family N-acetyltransferase [Epilithonimonas ginsengisoli]OAH68227.1 GNAT family acetyltransferase [Chryseobacterium sp. FP211-J200]